MSERGGRPVPGMSGWLPRILLALVLLGLGSFAGKQSLALAIRHRAINFAHDLAPGDARILASRSEVIAANAKGRRDWSSAAMMARRSLLRDPLNPVAVVTLGLDAGLRGDEKRATRLFAYSETISRRDLRTHLWAIEQAVASGDVVGALGHYDQALLTSRQASDILFPVLSTAISDGNIRNALAITLSKPTSRTWAVPFVRTLSLTGPDFPAVADLFVRLRHRGVSLPEGADASLLGALIANRRYDTAWRYASLTRPNLSRNQSRDPSFLASTAPSPLDWNPINDIGLSSTIQRTDTSGAFTFSAESGAGGLVLRQLQLLPPGRYRVISRLVELDPQGPSPFWTVQCVDGAEIGRFNLGAVQSRMQRSSSLMITAACPAQWLSLFVPVVDEARGMSGMLDYAAIVPVQ